MKLPNLFLALLVMFALPVQAATVSVSVTSLNGPCYTTSTGAFLDPGSVIRVGYFSAGNLATFQTSNDYAALDSLFTPLAEGIVGSGTISQIDHNSNLVTGNQLVINNFFGNTGHIFGSIENVAFGAVPIGTDLYVWVFNSATPASASEWGIFGSSLWEFPDSSTLPANESLASIDVDNFVRGQHVLPQNELRLSAVPEPGSLLLLVGAVAALRRRRR